MSRYKIYKSKEVFPAGYVSIPISSLPISSLPGYYESNYNYYMNMLNLYKDKVYLDGAINNLQYLIKENTVNILEKHCEK